LLGTAGCTQILGFDEDYFVVPTRSDGGDATPSGDASSADTSGGDASGRDVVTVETGGGGDDATGPDAPDPDATPDGPTPTFCQSLRPKPLFCEDFDEGVPLGLEWSYLHQLAGTLALYTSASQSGSASMQAMTQVVTSNRVVVDTAAYEDFSIPDAGSPSSGKTFSGSIDLDLRIDQVDSATGVAVVAQFGLTDGAGNGQYFLQFVVNSNGADPLGCVLNEDYFATSTSGSPTMHPLNATIPIDRWVHVQLSMVVPFAGGAGTGTAVINGGAPNTASIQVGVSNFQPSIGVGLTYASTPSNGWTVLVDNVVFNATTN